MRLEVLEAHPQPRRIHQAIEIVKNGGVIAYPTDTVYAFGCDIMNKRALDRLYRIKGMPKAHPVSFVCPDLSDIARYAFVDDWAYRIMKRLLPGPYTFILPASREVPRMVMRKRKTVGIRVPDHPVAQALVRELASPILSSSVSRDGYQYNDPEDIDADFKDLDLVIDVGWGGLEPSTILDLSGTEPEVLREGAGAIDF